MPDSFAHMHVHSDFSILDGGAKPKSYAERAAELGQPTLALTDHGSLSGAYTHWKECNRVGIRPIIGCEFYVAPGDRRLRVPEAGFGGNGKYAHLTVLARNADGLRNLYRLQSRAYSEGLYGKPRIDFDLLEEYREGLIVLSGCAGSHIAIYLRQGEFEKAEQLAQRLKNSFGDDFFIEVMSHGIDEPDLNEAELNADLIRLAQLTNIPLVATNDAHYCHEEDSSAHAALLCVQSKALLSDPKRFKFNGTGFHLRSRAEMDSLGLPTEALDNTLAITDRIESYDSVFAHILRMPRYSDDEGWDLETQATEGLQDRMTGGVITEEYSQRLEYELEVINSMGYPGYFLIEAHILREGRQHGLTHGPGRGSAGGSLVAYALGITDLDPIQHRLLFERFLNPARVSLPDIDVDVPESQRAQWLDLIRELYGDRYVASIGTFGTIGAKAALKDANRVLGGTFKRGEDLVKHLPKPRFGRQPGLDEFGGDRESDVYKLAVGLGGLIRSTGQHAAGVIISPDPLEDLIPLWHPAGQDMWVTGFHNENKNPELENLGFVKYDFLGLRNLDVINDCLRLLGNRGWKYLPLLPKECDDQRTYELLSSGNTLGIFQLDSPGMRGLLRLLRPKKFDDISAVLALYRPGPMGANAHMEFAHRANKSGGWNSEWAIHPDLEEALRPVLEDTYGLIVFQEQVMACLKTICGWSYAEAGLLFKAMAKKDHAKMEATRPAYQESGKRRGFSNSALDALWETLVPFADYSFNRAHTAGYGLIAYWTAYLKANYPAEYMASLLSSVANDPDRLHEYLGECERMGIELLSPDINVSQEGFTPDEQSIRYGLSAIRGVGDKAFKALASERPFSSLSDFIYRMPSNCLNVGVIRALIRSGSIDNLCSDREGADFSSDRFVELEQQRRKTLELGQPLLVQGEYAVKQQSHDVPLRRQWELETLGVTVSRSSVRLRLADVQHNEVDFIRRIIEQHPGNQRVTIDLGWTQMNIGRMNLSQSARQQLEALQTVEVIEA